MLPLATLAIATARTAGCRAWVYICYNLAMTADDRHDPESYPTLITTLPPRVLFASIKTDAVLLRNVFQGFTTRESTLTNPVVRQRLLREMERQPELVQRLRELWGDYFADLLAIITAPDFSPGAETIAPLLGQYGAGALGYGLQQSEREEVREWAARLSEVPLAAPATPAPPTPRTPVSTPDDGSAALRVQLAETKRELKEATGTQARLQRDLQLSEQKLSHALERETALQKQVKETKQQLDREQRRTKRAEEEAQALQKELATLRRQQTVHKEGTPAQPPAALSTEAADVIAQAIALLQQGLTLSRPAPATPKPVVAEPPTPTPPVRPAMKRAAEAAVVLTTARGKQTFPLAQIRQALVRNDAELIDRVRDGLARVANHPAAERQIREQLGKAGIPDAVLTGPLKPAVVDASNVANMSPTRHGRLSYLEEVRHSAWEEGYFPVYLIADASLPHQVDRPDDLMAMVERGEVRMVDAGTSADELLIEEATRLSAVILTNDRMANWPAAKNLEKRHVELHNDRARVGSFHRSAHWFPW